MKEDQCHDVAGPNSTLRVAEVDPQTDVRWEAFVTTIPDSLIYHHPAWLQVLKEAFGYKPAHLACEDADGQLRGILPLFYKRGLLTGRIFSSLPYTPVAGPLARDDQASALLVRSAVELARDKVDARLEFTTLSNALDGLVGGVVGGPKLQTYWLELPERPELLQIGNSRGNSSIKWALNKATRLGVQVRPAETERELWSWYRLYLDTMLRLSVLPRPYHFFKAVWERLHPRGLMRLLLAEHFGAERTKLLGGFLLLTYGQTVSHVYSGWSWQDRSLRPNDALHWRAIQDACAEGYCRYDFGEVGKNNQGLAEYKCKWGAKPKTLYCYNYPASQKLEIDIRAASSGARQLTLAALRRLPISTVALLSDWAHHYL